jgi:predicted Zn-dependent protease
MKKRLLTYAISCALTGITLVTSPVAGSNDRLNLPQMGEPADLVMSPSDEKHIGQGYMRKIRQYLDLVTDTEINHYIQSIGERLVATRADLNTGDFTFFVVRNPEINAFALPGGYIGINSGLITAANNEAELASVIAHETAHVTQRHIARLYASQGNNGYKTAAAIIAAILLSQQSAQAGQAALLTGLAATRQSAINFTRTHEYEADRIGIQLLSDAGYNPRSMVDFFEVLRRRVALNTTEQMEFLRTHPLTNNRISEARNNSSRLANPVGVRDTADFQLHQMKLRVMHSNNPQNLQRALANGHISNSESARLYGEILLLLQAGKSEQCLPLAERLIALQPNSLTVRLLNARVAVANNDTARAERLFGSVLDIYPDHYATVERYTEMLLRQRRSDRAERVIQSYIRAAHDPSPDVYKKYSNVLRQKGRTAASYEAMADHFFLLDENREAISQLRLALKSAPEGSNEASRISARLDRSGFR